MPEPEGNEGTEAQAQEGQGAEGSSRPSWTDQLREGLRENEVFSQFPSVTDLGKSYLELQQKAKSAEGAVRIPDENASDREKAEFFTRLGKPESADQYELAEEGLPEGVKVDEDFKNEYRMMAHDLNLTRGQAEKLYGWYHQKLLSSLDEVTRIGTEEVKKAEETLRKDFGREYDGNVELAHRAILHFGSDDLFKLLEKAKVGGVSLGNHPDMIRTFVNIGKSMSEDMFIRGEQGGETKAVEADGQLHYEKSPELYRKKE